MAIRLIMIAGAVLNINIYGKYGSKIFKWFAVFFIFIIAVYVALSLFALH